MSVTGNKTNHWKTVNERVYVRLFRGVDDLVHGDVTEVVSVGNVVSNTAVEEHRFLRDYAYLTSQPLDVEGLRRVTVKHL